MLIGLSAAVPSCAVLLRVDCPVDGVGVDPRNPPLVWEAWNGSGWSACEVDRDETGGLNKAGDVVLHVPATHEQSLNARQRAGWLRCRVLPPDGVTPAYTRSPRISGVQAMTIGGTAEIAHAETVRDEALGTSDGTPGQRFVAAAPAGRAVDRGERPAGHRTGGDRRRRRGCRCATSPTPGPTTGTSGSTRWRARSSFGPAVRHADGELRQYGAVPPLGSRLSMSAYRIGGGRRGNVARGVVRVLKSSVPYVTRVENRHPAAGGVDGETIDNAKLRGPLELRASGRAVTAEDFEVLARDVAPDAARVACLPATSAGAAAAGTAALPGAVRLLVVPAGGRPTTWAGSPSTTCAPRRASCCAGSATTWTERRLVGTRLVVEPPFYQGVTVVARVTAGPDARAETVQERGAAGAVRLPVAAGRRAGRARLAVRARGAGVRRLRGARPRPGARRGRATCCCSRPTRRRAAAARRCRAIDLAPGALVYSYQHQVRVQG